eukprot:4032966-Amphidinium_carterae.1
MLWDVNDGALSDFADTDTPWNLTSQRAKQIVTYFMPQCDLSSHTNLKLNTKQSTFATWPGASRTACPP